MRNVDGIEMLDYQELLNELDLSKPNNHLLLGNGFSISLGVKTGYKDIFEKMCEMNPIYKKLGNEEYNVEEIIRQCICCINNDDNNEYSIFTKEYLKKQIKLDFAKALTKIVSKETKNVYRAENKKIYLLLKEFDSYFSLNFDPFLYDLLMLFKKDKEDVLSFEHYLPEMKKLKNEDVQKIMDIIENALKDGKVTISIGKEEVASNMSKMNKKEFEKNVKEFLKNGNVSYFYEDSIQEAIDKIWEDRNQRTKGLNPNDAFSSRHSLTLFDDFKNFPIYGEDISQNLFFLHGAFHIVKHNGEYYKITQSKNTQLYKRLQNFIGKDGCESVCIIEGTTEEKMKRIENDVYLNDCLKKLKDLSGNLVIIGSSLADNDKHIFDAIESSRIDKIYYASYGFPSDGKYEKSYKKIQEEIKSLKKHFPHKNIALYDRNTADYVKK